MDPKEGHDLKSQQNDMDLRCILVISFWNKFLTRWWFQILFMNHQAASMVFIISLGKFIFFGISI